MKRRLLTEAVIRLWRIELACTRTVGDIPSWQCAETQPCPHLLPCDFGACVAPGCGSPACRLLRVECDGRVVDAHVCERHS